MSCSLALLVVAADILALTQRVLVSINVEVQDVLIGRVGA